MSSSTPEPVALPPAEALAALLDDCGEAVALTDAAGRIRWASAGFHRLAGLPAGAADLHGLEETGALLAGSAREAGWNQRGSDGIERYVELRVTRRDAALHWVLADRTAQRDAEARARRLAERLDMAQEFGRLGTWERDVATGVGRWDDHMFAFWGLDPSRGTPSVAEALQHVHPDDRDRVRQHRLAPSTGHFSQRFRVVGADGVPRWMHAQWEVKPGPDGRPARVVGVMMDDTEVYRLAQSLGDTSAQLRLAVDLGNIAIWRHDLKTDRLYYNDRAFAVLDIAPRPEGLSLAEVRELIHADDMPTVIASAQRALETDRPTDMEARYRRSDGSWRSVLTRRVVQRGPDGQPRAFVGVALDITEQVEQRQRAAELAQRLEIAADAAQIGIWWRDPVSGAGEWNAKMFELTGRDPAGAAPSREEWLDSIVHPDDRAYMSSAPAMLIDQPAAMREHEFRIVRPDGAVRWFVTRARREFWQGRPLAFGVTMDVTDRRTAEAALRSADQRAALAARGVGIGTWETDLDGTVERWDEQMFRLRGLEPADRPPTRAQRLAIVHPDDRGLVIDALPHPLADDRLASYEFRVVWPDGGVRWLASRSSAVRDKHGHVVARIGVNWDVTEAKEGEIARREKAVAERESRAKSQFLARMSHELRTPLNAVLGFTQLLQLERDAGSSESRRVKLGHIRSAGEHLLELIDDVLDLSRLEAGQMRLEFETVDLRTLVDEALPLVQTLADAHQVEVATKPVRGLARADRTRLLQVLINLLTNAVKYNRPGGRVQVDAEPVGAEIRLRVADSGRGLSREQVAHLFEPFNRLGVERESVEGSGIGLTIVKALVESMGGTVSATSEPGEGTIFTVVLPASRDATAAAPPRPLAPDLLPAHGTRAGHGTILYVEDNEVNVTLVEELVRGYTDLAIVCEPDGTRGVERALALRPDLVLIDMQLPDFDGIEVLRRLRADPRTAPIPCIALSANAMPDDIARALGAGFADYWTKPIVFKDFVASLGALFPTTPA